LYKSSLKELYRIGNVSYHGSSAMNESEPLVGRPHGGCAIIWPNELNCKFDPVDIAHERLCAVRIHLDSNVTVLLINVYLPCDSRNRDNQYVATVDVLNLISCLINEQKCDFVIVAGDMNAHLTRHTPHVQAVKNFIQNNDLHTGLDHVLADVDHTFHSLSNNSYSLIDHICVCDSMFANITQYVTIDTVENMSDHVALKCSFEVSLMHNRQDRSFSQRPAWHRATDTDVAQFKLALDEMLEFVPVPLNAIHCSDYGCPITNSHRNELDTFLSDIVLCCIEAENICIPKTTNKVKGNIPGWNDFVKGLHHEALYWHDLWKDAGRPHDGHLADKMRQSRHDYHYAIRFCKRNRDSITSMKMADALQSGRNRDFWKEVKNMQKSKKTIPTVVDNANNKHDIAELFHTKFKDLYNMTGIDSNSMESILSELNKRIVTCNKQSHAVTVNTVKRLAHKLKRDKYDGLHGLNSSCIVYGSQRLHTLLSMYFSAVISHGHTSEMLYLGTLCPIPKSSNLNISEKYRAIALCSSIAKLFDMIFIDKHKPNLSTDPLQFGFKEERSTSLCTLFLTGIATKFVNEGSSVYTALLDMSKAFDRVNIGRLFEILLHRNMDPLYVRCLFHMYCKQRLRVKWDDVFSPFFSATNGVKQGGVLSPLLFCTYVDELLGRLRKSSYGCYIGPCYAGALCYADDVVLLSPSVTGLRQMLQICKEFAVDYSLTFNAAKSQLIIFRPKPRHRLNPGNVTIDFGGTSITEQQSVSHLGHTVYNDLTQTDSDRILASFYKQYNLFRSKFGHIPSSIQAKLFETYGSSFYGCTLLPFGKTGPLQVAWRKCLRQVWRTPYQTHCALLRCLKDKLCEFHVFLSRFCKFALSALQSKCETVAYIVKCIKQVRCPFASNFIYLANLLEVHPDVLETVSVSAALKDIQLCCNTTCKSELNLSLASVVNELAQARDNVTDCPLTQEEIRTIITDICLN